MAKRKNKRNIDEIYIAPVRLLTVEAVTKLIMPHRQTNFDAALAEGSNMAWSIVAMHGNRCVAHWEVDRPQIIKGRRFLHARLTYVSSRWRGLGIAMKLWEAGIEYWKPDEVTVYIGSDAGYDFLLRAVPHLTHKYGVRIQVDSGDYHGFHEELADRLLAVSKSSKAKFKKPKLRLVA